MWIKNDVFCGGLYWLRRHASGFGVGEFGEMDIGIQ